VGGGDLRMENVFVSDGSDPLVADYGLADLSAISDWAYPAPELPCAYTEAVDVFAWAALARDLLGEPPPGLRALLAGAGDAGGRPRFATILSALTAEAFALAGDARALFQRYVVSLACPRSHLPPVLNARLHRHRPALAAAASHLPPLERADSDVERHYQLGLSAFRARQHALAFSHLAVAAKAGHVDVDQMTIIGLMGGRLR
jgi:hypothetical protein